MTSHRFSIARFILVAALLVVSTAVAPRALAEDIVIQYRPDSRHDTCVTGWSNAYNPSVASFTIHIDLARCGYTNDLEITGKIVRTEESWPDHQSSEASGSTVCPAGASECSHTLELPHPELEEGAYWLQWKRHEVGAPEDWVGTTTLSGSCVSYIKYSECVNRRVIRTH